MMLFLGQSLHEVKGYQTHSHYVGGHHLLFFSWHYLDADTVYHFDIKLTPAQLEV